MDIKQAKEILNEINPNGYCVGSGATDNDIDEAINIAIKSLDMWNKVIEEIKNLNNENPLKNYRPWLYEDEVIEIIKKYIKEVEK